MHPEKRFHASQKEAAARFILVGGFLGAGKTTCMAALTNWLRQAGRSCGLITNDLGRGLVDTVMATSSSGHSCPGTDKEAISRMVREISGGCFCCRIDQLVAALRDLESTLHPDVLLAEPVGSCTDLVATVLLPLEEIHHTGLKRAPISVVLDGRRVWSEHFSRARGSQGFSKDVRYVYRKQMEEAEILVVNKSDLLKPGELPRLKKRLEMDFPAARVLCVSARTGEGMEEWFHLVMNGESSPQRVMEVDYAQYGRGEMLLGWYNARLHWNGMKGDVLRIDGNAVLEELARGIQQCLERQGVEIAHFKMSLRTQAGSDLTVVNAVRNGSPAEISRRMAEPVTSGEILINLRAEGAPELLEATVRGEFHGLPVTWLESAAFRPVRPKPAHRIANLTNI